MPSTFYYDLLAKFHFRYFVLTKPLSLLTFFLLTISSALSRPDTPCLCNAGSTVIGSDGVTTDITSTNLLPNTCYIIRGILNINSTSVTVWDEMRFLKAEGSQILVSTNLLISDSYISGCTEMWKGIKTIPSSTLWIYEGTAVESAEFGVLLADKTRFLCRDVEFINNYIGIATGNPFADNTSNIYITQIGELTGCEFYTHTNLPDPYPGHYYYPSWPSTPIGIPFNQGYAGIYLSLSDGLNIGSNGPLTTGRNEFYQLRNGIIMRKSTSEVEASDFYDFEGSVAKVTGHPLLDLNQYGINIWGGFANIEDNTFFNIKRGVFTERSFGPIHNNEFDIPTNDLVPASNRGIVATSPHHSHVITSNLINNGYRGIEVIQGGTGFLTIYDNRLIREVELDRNTAIEINSCRFPNLTVGSVSFNDITINDEASSIGVAVINSTNVVLDENAIDYLKEDNIGNDNIGIALMNSWQTQATWNRVIATSAYETDDNNIGILDRSDISRFFCNTMDHFFTLLRIAGTGPMTDVFSNQLFHGTIGFELVAPIMIGPHPHRENKWFGPFNNNGAFITGPDDLVIASAAGSRFRVNQNETGNMPPNIGPAAAVGANWFTHAVGSGFECEDPIPIIEYDEDTLVSLVHHDFDFEEYSSHMEWLVKANIFEIILNDPSLKSNVELDSFFDAEENTILGELVQAQIGLFSRHGVNKSSKDDTADRIMSLSNDIVYIDSIVTADGPSSYGTWLSLRISKCDSMATEKAIWKDLCDDEDDASIAAYEVIHDDLTGMTPTNDLEDYLRSALLLYGQYILGEGISTGDSADLVDLINLCPIEGGRAIGIAQGLYSIIADSNMVAHMPACPSPPPFAIGLPTITYPDFQHLSVFPNPASGELWIKSKEQIDALHIYGSDFRTIFASNPESYKTNVDLSLLSNGIYVVTIHTQSGVYSQKIALLK